MDKNQNYSFSILPYGDLVPFNETISKARCRIFYKYANRNHTYITDEAAEIMLESLPYAPIKGVYISDDFTDHSLSRQDGRIYGIVPGEPNVKWEKHLDEDGVEREYACVDVLLYTALYEEAKEIIDKALSMELYPPFTKGEEEEINGELYYRIDEAKFLGIQVLGDKYTPCFEGASFYSAFYDVMGGLYHLFTAAKSIDEEKNSKEDYTDMFILKLSDEDKRAKIYDALNPINEETGERSYKYYIVATYEDYCIVSECNEEKLYKAPYTIDENDKVVLGEKEEVVMVAVTNEEAAELNQIRSQNNDTFTNVSEVYTKGLTADEKISELEETLSTKNDEIFTLNSEKESLTTEINGVKEELAVLSNFKLTTENAEKQKIVEQYKDKLDTEVYERIVDNIVSYSIIDLEKDLAYELVKSKKADLFTTNSSNGIVIKDEPLEGIAAILEKYI